MNPRIIVIFEDTDPMKGTARSAKEVSVPLYDLAQDKGVLLRGALADAREEVKALMGRP